MWKFKLLIPAFLFYVADLYAQEVFYRSDALGRLDLPPVSGQAGRMNDKWPGTSPRHADSAEFTVLEGRAGLPYWFRRVKTPVCHTGECKPVDVGLYWYITGEFLGLEVYGEHLTKTDHSVFTEQDYKQLMEVLYTEWPLLREYGYADLMTGRDTGSVDGVAGATQQEIVAETVDGAVFTTYTLWHLAHTRYRTRLRNLTLARLNSPDSDWVTALAGSGERKYALFLLELFAGGGLKDPVLVRPLVLDGLRAEDDPVYRKLAIQSLARGLPVAGAEPQQQPAQEQVPADNRHPQGNGHPPASGEDPFADSPLPEHDRFVPSEVTGLQAGVFQAELARIYTRSSKAEKLAILTALKLPPASAQPRLTDTLYNTLTAGLPEADEWFAVKILAAVQNQGKHPKPVLEVAQKLSESEHRFIRQEATRFLDAARKAPDLYK